MLYIYSINKFAFFYAVISGCAIAQCLSKKLGKGANKRKIMIIGPSGHIIFTKNTKREHIFHSIQWLCLISKRRSTLVKNESGFFKFLGLRDSRFQRSRNITVIYVITAISLYNTNIGNMWIHISFARDIGIGLKINYKWKLNKKLLSYYTFML